MWDIVQNDIGQWRIFVHVGDPIMNNGHCHSSEPGDEETIHHSDTELPSLWERVAGNVGLATRGAAGARWSR